MSRITPYAFGLALPLTLFSQAAFADLTPAQVWSDWRAYMQSVGYQVAATETANGDDLSVSGITLNFAAPEGSGDMKMQLTLDAIDFRQNSDGSVAIVMPNVMPMTFSGKEAGANGQDVAITMNITQTDHAMTATGAPNDVTYDYTAQTVVMDVDQVVLDETAAVNDTAKMSFTANGVQSTTNMKIGDMRAYDQTSSIGSASYTVNVETPNDGGQKANINGTVSGITVGGKGTLPLIMPDKADMAAMMKAGFDVAGQIAYASGSSFFDVQDPQDGSFKVEGSSQGGTLDVAMGANGLAYGASQKDLKMAINVTGMPVPFEIALAESGFNLALPVQKADEAQDFALGITMGNFTMSDVIWGMFDGAGQLPRDPATIMLDLSGKAKVLVDYMSPEVATGLSSAPGELEAVKLNTLLVDAAGAKLEGSGDITFDGAGPAMVPGVGTPVGAVNLALAGGNGLLDKLTAMGLLPQEQAMGARMMMGIFAVPGDAPDTLKSTIEFTQDGQILANGQRIR